MAELELINYTWEAIKSGIIYDGISFLSKKIFANLVKAQNDDKFENFKGILETALELNENLKDELEKHIKENKDEIKLKAGDNSRLIGKIELREQSSVKIVQGDENHYYNSDNKDNHQNNSLIRASSPNIKQESISKTTLSDIENLIMNLFRENEFSYLSDIEKEFKECKKSEIKYYLDNLEELGYLMFYQRNNIDDGSRDYYELSKNGRKYLYEKKV